MGGRPKDQSLREKARSSTTPGAREELQKALDEIAPLNAGSLYKEQSDLGIFTRPCLPREQEFYGTPTVYRFHEVAKRNDPPYEFTRDSTFTK